MAEDGLSASSASSHKCPEPYHKPPFSAAFTRPLDWGFRDEWPDLAYGISGVWALGPKLWFQNQHKRTQVERRKMEGFTNSGYNSYKWKCHSQV
jgi:hypothetical protein